jgi:ABC-type multidrug transport system permease subunit
MAATIRMTEAQARFIGNLVRWDPVMTPGMTGADAIGPAERGRFLALIAEQPTVSVSKSYAGRGRPVPEGMGQSAPGIMVMFVVMTVLISGAQSLTLEKEKGTLRRLAATPLRRGEIIGGKVAGLTLLGLVQALIVIVCTEVIGRLQLFGVDFVWGQHLPGLIVVVVPLCFCVAAIGLFLGGVFRTSQQAESLSWLVGLVMAALGGSWWPLEIVPDTMRRVGHLFPTAWAMDGLHAVLSFGQGIPGALPPASVVFAMGVLFLFLGSRALRFTD